MDRPDHLEKEIFNDALELGSVEAREAYLEAACANDAQLRRRVDALLAASRAVDGFLPVRATVEPASGPTGPNSEGPGAVIGRYKLLEEIGQGGFGVVYMAEQLEPVRRKVALKVIKPGMDTRQVIARFEAERQALAIMDHPNIAKVFDAGVTTTGRSYFVMELVRGIAITRFCDENRLSTRDRVEMFAQVCRAIQHAHQKGIIHRDIKPSNILVTINDGVPVPRTIDFGIAKATHPPALTDKTLFTAFAQFIGTPAYMSPEQACMNNLDIDTRSDIYSLGVLLYELLTGHTPFDAKALLAAGVEEMRRTIREQEPVRPSTRLKSMARDDLMNAARLRHSEPPKLIHLLRGDLDWIVIKCLEKDRTRRYQTAHALADDVERHLRDEPVLARSPSVFYLALKFARKHRIRLAIGAALTSLLAALAVLATMYWRSSKLAWARAEALPRVIELVKRGDNRAAFDLAGKIQPWISEDPALIELWPRICGDISLTTTPPGAKVWCREYTATNEPWLYLGRSPLEKVMLPRCTYRWRFELESFAPHECVADHGLDQHGPWHVRLSEEGPDEGMVWINAGENRVATDDFATMRSIRVPAFRIDRYEVTNERFQQFVDSGGYRNSHDFHTLKMAPNSPGPRPCFGSSIKPASPDPRHGEGELTRLGKPGIRFLG
ncbi:MAG: protein kinase [Verrucomicrobiia bacterium]